jgi:hypothetical protein
MRTGGGGVVFERHQDRPSGFAEDKQLKFDWPW